MKLPNRATPSHTNARILHAFIGSCWAPSAVLDASNEWNASEVKQTVQFDCYIIWTNVTSRLDKSGKKRSGTELLVRISLFVEEICFEQHTNWYIVTYFRHFNAMRMYSVSGPCDQPRNAQRSGTHNFHQCRTYAIDGTTVRA